jgi:hypothetical protein
MAIAPFGVRAARTARGATWAGTPLASTRWGGALNHLAVGDALRHHFRCPDSRPELLGPVLRLEPDEVLVWLEVHWADLPLLLLVLVPGLL